MEILLEKELHHSPEQRVVDQYEKYYNDVTTLAAEMLDGSMQTSFEYEFDGQELYAQDGSSIGEVFEKAESDAYVIARKDPRLACEIRRRGDDCEKGEYKAMIEMAKGVGPNTMIVTSDAPAELEEWGEDVGGYNFQRKQTMLRVISRLPDGKIRVTSQTLDGSDRDGLEGIHEFFGNKPRSGELLGQRIHAEIDPQRQDLLVDELTREYDRTLEGKFGGRYYAGRTPVDMENTYQFVLRQADLLEAFMQSPDDENLFGLVAALENRWNVKKADQHGEPKTTDNFLFTDYGADPRQEMMLMAQRATQQNKTYSGCGVTMSGDQAEAQLGSLGYGNQSAEDGGTVGGDQYGSLQFKCPKGHLNTRPRGKLLDCCKTCGSSVKC